MKVKMEKCSPSPLSRFRLSSLHLTLVRCTPPFLGQRRLSPGALIIPESLTPVYARLLVLSGPSLLDRSNCTQTYRLYTYRRYAAAMSNEFC